MTAPWLSLSVVEAAVAFAARRGVGFRNRGRRGFGRAYSEARGDPKAMEQAYSRGADEPWALRRLRFIQAHPRIVPLYEAHGPFKGWPTRRHLLAILWAYSPDPEGVARWFAKEATMEPIPTDPTDPMDDRSTALDAALAECASLDLSDADERAEAVARLCAVLDDLAEDDEEDEGSEGGEEDEAEDEAEDEGPTRGLLALTKACQSYTEREGGCDLFDLKVEGAAVELGTGAYLAFTRLPDGEALPVLGYDLPDRAEAYYHPLDPDTKVYVLDGCVVLGHPNLRLTDRGLHEPEGAAEEAEGEGEEPVLAVEPDDPAERPWRLTIYTIDDVGTETIAARARRRTKEAVLRWYRRVMASAFEDDLEGMARTEVRLDQEGMVDLPGLRLVLRGPGDEG